MRVKEDIATVKQQDIYSLILFALFKLRDIPEYSTLSELAYLLDKESLLKLCEYFGGLTIKIPTVEDLESMVYSLVLYQQIDVEGKTYNEAIKGLGCTPYELQRIKEDYKELSKVLEDYDFGKKGTT